MPQASPPALSPLELREPCAHCGEARGKHRAFDEVCRRFGPSGCTTTFAPVRDTWER